MSKKIKLKKLNLILYRAFEEYAYREFGRLFTRLSPENFAKWLDWRNENPDKMFWRFERFL